ncbi:hypothetical protein FPZ24_15280 [Sphingomonas panacisoli]|uniref:Uncharacterized protein n=1 Tax=Sphingomonas panacisoli TaxID=1813879 RepID=A0A5B8LNK6_9SPHN|nr:hypothetical protein [Sphingomonas panacisoli]QDZ08660.1 hypothetical protein FPZ24_15280 [Sphingomonas panacisoli]
MRIELRNAFSHGRDAVGLFDQRFIRPCHFLQCFSDVAITRGLGHFSQFRSTLRVIGSLFRSRHLPVVAGYGWRFPHRGQKLLNDRRARKVCLYRTVALYGQLLSDLLDGQAIALARYFECPFYRGLTHTHLTPLTSESNAALQQDDRDHATDEVQYIVGYSVGYQMFLKWNDPIERVFCRHRKGRQTRRVRVDHLARQAVAVSAAACRTKRLGHASFSAGVAEVLEVPDLGLLRP